MRIRLLTLILLFLFGGPLPLFSQIPVSLAVLTFKNNTGEMYLQSLQNTIADQLKTQLSGYRELTVVEREHIDAVLKEQALGQSGIIPEDQAVKIGQLTNARYIIYGEYSGKPGQLTITAQVIQVASGQLTGEKVTGNAKKHLHKMVEILAYNIRHTLPAPGAPGETYNKKHGWFASLAILSGVSFVSSGVFYTVYRDSYYNKYADAIWVDEIEKYYNRAYQMRRLSAVFTGIGSALGTVTVYFWLRSVSPSNYIYTGRVPASCHQLALWLPVTGTGLQYHYRF
jgi:TolB-like protein